MTPILVGQYQPGTSVIHRLPVGVKVAVLAAVSVSIVSVRSTETAFVFLGLAAIVAVCARLRWRPIIRQLSWIVACAVVIAGFQWWLFGLGRAIESLLDLVSLALFATIVMATTPVHALLDAVVRWLRPVPFVDADRVALLLTLAMQSFPASIQLAYETRDAASARGLGHHPRIYLAPYVIRVVSRAQHTGDALTARGLGD